MGVLSPGITLVSLPHHHTAAATILKEGRSALTATTASSTPLTMEDSSRPRLPMISHPPQQGTEGMTGREKPGPLTRSPALGPPPVESFSQPLPEPVVAQLTRFMVTLGTMIPTLAPQSNAQPPPSLPTASPPLCKWECSHLSAGSYPDSSDSSSPEVSPYPRESTSHPKGASPQVTCPDPRARFFSSGIPKTICPGWPLTPRGSSSQTTCAPLSIPGRMENYWGEELEPPQDSYNRLCPPGNNF